MKGIKRFWL